MFYFNYTVVEVFQSIGVVLNVEKNVVGIFLALENLLREIFFLGVAEYARNQILEMLSTKILESEYIN